MKGTTVIKGKKRDQIDTKNQEIYERLWKQILHEEIDRVVEANNQKIITRTQDRVRDAIKTKLS